MSWIFTWTDLTRTATKMAMPSVRYLWRRWRVTLPIVKGTTCFFSCRSWLTRLKANALLACQQRHRKCWAATLLVCESKYNRWNVTMMSEAQSPLQSGQWIVQLSDFCFCLSVLQTSQLEAIIRISESLAKMTLSTVVQHHHVEEAIRLFKFSTMDAVSAGSADGLSRGELNDEMTRIERELRRRLPVGWSTSYQSLVREFVTQQNYSSHALERSLFIMEKREIIRFSGQKKVVHRWVLLCFVP